jgi:hypothetical protein
MGMDWFRTMGWAGMGLSRATAPVGRRRWESLDVLLVCWPCTGSRDKLRDPRMLCGPCAPM